uniref:Uncharacterized protein n=1 Tax=Anguilla anguilla TaxID=7936 RepID=A0A0E9W9E6_ANGAN
MVGPNTLHPVDQWCNFITQPTNGVTSSLSQITQSQAFAVVGLALWPCGPAKKIKRNVVYY